MNIDLEAIYLYVLSQTPFRKLEMLERLRQQAGSFENAYVHPIPQLRSTVSKLQTSYSIEKLYESLKTTGVNMLTYFDPKYPKLLKEIHDPPPVLFYRGRLMEFDETCIAIVGSRKMSSYGSAAVPIITQPLIRANVTIVSGLAYGADSAAHAECVKMNARTIAVLGSGVDSKSIYPRGHVQLAHNILDNDGLLISEYPPGTPGFKHHFVARNRIIAGLSSGVVVIECKPKSGALITTDFATDYNRNVYAVPGPIYSNLSEGPHSLIQNGASLITNGNEVLPDLAITIPVQIETDSQHQKLFTSEEKHVLECMKDTVVTIDTIIQLTNLSSHAVSNAITTLELKEKIKNIGVNGFIKI